MSPVWARAREFRLRNRLPQLSVLQKSSGIDMRKTAVVGSGRGGLTLAAKSPAAVEQFEVPCLLVWKLVHWGHYSVHGLWKACEILWDHSRPVHGAEDFSCKAWKYIAMKRSILAIRSLYQLENIGRPRSRIKGEVWIYLKDHVIAFGYAVVWAKSLTQNH